MMDMAIRSCKNRVLMTILALVLPLGFIAHAQTAYKLDPKVEQAGLKSLTKGVEYLLKTQKKDGSWGKFPHPAIVALCAMAIHNAPGIDKARSKAAVDKALDFVLNFKQPDGSIFPAAAHKDNPKQSGFYPNYTTSIALLTLATVNRPQDKQRMIAARKYLQETQFLDKSKLDYGGIGYGKTGRADLSNGSFASEALYYTDYLDKEPHAKDPVATQKKTKEMWTAMQSFLTKCQNLPETNKESYVSTKKEDGGGAIYRPNESKASPKGTVSNLASSGSMTYALLKSMLYARMKRDDIRVKAAMEYLTRNYTLKENPGMGLQGHYYYLHVLTKALDAFGVDTVTTTDKKKHDWRKEILEQFLSMQKENGSWANTHGRFFETLPELATSYTVVAMKIALGKADLKFKKN
jgi:squalene-hopene/tetraprenyl-beta-curcumene cyclase